MHGFVVIHLLKSILIPTLNEGPLIGRWNKFLEIKFPLRPLQLPASHPVSPLALAKRVASDQILMLVHYFLSNEPSFSIFLLSLPQGSSRGWSYIIFQRARLDSHNYYFADRHISREHGRHGRPIWRADQAKVLGPILSCLICQLESVAFGSGMSVLSISVTTITRVPKLELAYKFSVYAVGLPRAILADLWRLLDSVSFITELKVCRPFPTQRLPISFDHFPV